MSSLSQPGASAAVRRYFPAIECGVFDSPVDALVFLCVARDEAMELITAAWSADPALSVLATLDGGRHVAIVRTVDDRWAACNAYPEFVYAMRSEAERKLLRLIRRGRRGHVGVALA